LPGPLIPRRQLGRRMRRHRGATAPVAVAEYLDITKSTLNKIENGKQPCKVSYVRLFGQYFNLPQDEVDQMINLARGGSEEGWWAPYAGAIPDWFEDFLGQEGEAQSVFDWPGDLIYGPLQHPDYTALSVLAVNRDATDAEVQRSQEIRRQRAELLFRDDGPELHVVLNESAFDRLKPAPEVRRAQARTLLEHLERPKTTIQVLTYDAGLYSAIRSPFTILGFPEDEEMDFVYLENERGGQYFERKADLDRYRKIAAELAEDSLDRRRTKKWLEGQAVA
jgi:DNA-binding XRE family transcriptional regulator